MKKSIVGLKTKFIMTLLAVGVIPFVVLGMVSHTNAVKALTDQVFNQYKSIGNLKKSQIELFFADCLGDVDMMAHTPYVIDAFKSFRNGFYNRWWFFRGTVPGA